ncbi:MAG: hypothetical protein WAK48_21510 [Candidatus Acidiferrum sp.]|jgi:hypothetical protein
MANRAYLRVWTRDFSEQTMIAEFARFLTTAPLTEGQGNFQQLTVQPLGTSETPVEEWDLKEGVFGPAEVAALAAQYINEDTAYIVQAQWDLWSFDMESLKWSYGPQPLVLVCQGKAYDGGLATTEGHFHADLGFEHFFTGHAGLLAPGAAKNPFEISDHRLEKTFRSWMSTPENLKQYHQKTRENIQKLFGWVESVEAALPVERSELWSEGEENFEARLDAILAQR